VPLSGYACIEASTMTTEKPIAISTWSCREIFEAVGEIKKSGISEEVFDITNPFEIPSYRSLKLAMAVIKVTWRLRETKNVTNFF